jgi:sulfatase modifying factor 1
MRSTWVPVWLFGVCVTAGVACGDAFHSAASGGGGAGLSGDAGRGDAGHGDAGGGDEGGSPSHPSGGDDAGAGAAADAGGEAGTAGSGELGGSGGQAGTGVSAGSGGTASGGHGGAAGASGSGGSAGSGGAGSDQPPSCVGLSHTCGPTGTASCCASALVPEGTFWRSNDAAAVATVSSFRLDVYEVTVGRFRKFLAGYPGNKPTAGSGKNPNNPADPGWDASSPLPSSQAALRSAVACEPGRNDTWTDTPGANESRPMNCLTRYVAGAFCIWDGGRLPTEAEWNYAAAGGDEQRRRPWSNPPSSETMDSSYAVYATSATANVGAHSPKGDGLWGHADLAGNIWEWVQDSHAAYVTPCTNCANLTDGLDGLIRGGSYAEDGSYLFSWNRLSDPPSKLSADIGVRCARKP